MNPDSPYLKELLGHLEGPSALKTYKSLLAMATGWYLLLDGLWRFLASANVPNSVEALNHFSTLCMCAAEKPIGTCVEWLTDSTVNRWAPECKVDDSKFSKKIQVFFQVLNFL